MSFSARRLPMSGGCGWALAVTLARTGAAARRPDDLTNLRRVIRAICYSPEVGGSCEDSTGSPGPPNPNDARLVALDFSAHGRRAARADCQARRADHRAS